MDRDTPRPGDGARAGPAPAWEAAPRSNPTAKPRPQTPRPQDEAPADAFKDAMRSLGEAREYLAYFLAAKMDGIRLSLRRLGILAAVGVIGLLAGSAIVVTSAVLLCLGLAQGLAVLFAGEYGPRLWLGNLIVGIALLLLIVGGAWFGMTRLIGSSKKATVKKYELRRQRQRADFGRDVLQRASERGEGK